ncbi:MAG: 2TM domain-containing protein [Leptolyngbyaceae cyanobacterium]
MAAPVSRLYSTEAVQQILQKAMIYGDHGQFTETQLLEMAAELSIEPDAVQQAAQDWQGEVKRQAQKRDRRQRYRQQVATYAGVNTLLIGINLATAGAITWAIYPLLGWGIGLCFGPCDSKGNCRAKAVSAEA